MLVEIIGQAQKDLKARSEMWLAPNHSHTSLAEPAAK
jgi:hypothetical protein